jgi:hypothetical protein
VTWENTYTDLADMMRMATATSRPQATDSVPFNADPEAGEVNCRFWDQTYRLVNNKSCEKMADANRMSIEKFFMLNPEVERDCGNIRPYTRYCVRGCEFHLALSTLVCWIGVDLGVYLVIEPLRAYDGKCGPMNNNATCMSSGHGDCCNLETWTCDGREASLESA